jgi:hypothetical protein
MNKIRIKIKINMLIIINIIIIININIINDEAHVYLVLPSYCVCPIYRSYPSFAIIALLMRGHSLKALIISIPLLYIGNYGP